MKKDDYIKGASLFEKLEHAVARAVNLRTALVSKESVLSLSDAERWHEGEIYVWDECEVMISWTTSWGGGGRDSGVCTIPMEALCDDTYEEFITNNVAHLVRKKIGLDEQKYQQDMLRTEVKERAELVRLQAKWGTV